MDWASWTREAVQPRPPRRDPPGPRGAEGVADLQPALLPSPAAPLPEPVPPTHLRRTSDEPLALPQTEGGSSINILVFKGGSGTSTGKRRRRLWMKGYECHPLCPCNKSLRSPRKERHKIMDLLRDTTEEIDPVFGRIHF